MAVPTINSISLGKVERIRSEKYSDMTISGVPNNDSDSTVVVDTAGAVKSIEVKGIMTGTNVANLKTNLDAIEALIDGDQKSTVVFSSDITGNINVKINNFNFSYTTETRVTAEYNLSIVESA